MYKSEDDFAGNCFNVSTIVEGIPANFNADTLSTRLCGTDFYGEFGSSSAGIGLGGLKSVTQGTMGYSEFCARMILSNFCV